MRPSPLSPELSTAWSRTWGRLWLAIAPRWIRQPVGLWRWEELLEDRGEGYWSQLYADSHNAQEVEEHARRPTPVERLLAWGIEPPLDEKPWPRRFSSLASSGNWDNFWRRVPERELDAWIHVWKQHPQGQECLDRALAGLAGAGVVSAVEKLVKAGADPNEDTRDGSAMYQVWGSPHLKGEGLALTWKALNEGVLKPSWPKWLEGSRPWARLRPMEVLRSLEGLPLPTGEAALWFALVCVRDPPLSWGKPVNDTDEHIQSLEWWRTHGKLNEMEGATARLVAEWAATIRPGLQPHYQEAVNRWFMALTQGKPLPACAGSTEFGQDGWSHVFMRCYFAKNMPANVRDHFFQAPDAWTALGGDQQTALQILEARGIKQHWQEDSAFLALQRFAQAGQKAAHLEERWVDPPTDNVAKLRSRL